MRRLLYLSSVLPKRSETFVSGEILGLRERGELIQVATLREPERLEEDPRLRAMGEEAVRIYPPGLPALLRDACRMGGRLPALLGWALRDVCMAGDLKWSGRSKVPLQALAGAALAHRVRAWEPAHLHVHFAHAAATVGMFAARALGIPFSMTGHAADLFRERGLLREKLARASFVACISEWHREWYRGIVPGDDRKYPIVRCGVEVPEEPATPGEGEVLRIFALGRHVSKKGFDVLLEAVRGMTAPCEVTLAGEGPESERLKALAAGLPVEFPGAIPHLSVPDWMQRADVVVLPCRTAEDGDRDGIPVVLMEAMALGICVVSGDLPAIRELIEHEVTGLLVPPGDAQALATVLERLAKDPERRRILGRAGRERVKAEFSRAINIDRLQRAFDAVAGGE